MSVLESLSTTSIRVVRGKKIFSPTLEEVSYDGQRVAPPD